METRTLIGRRIAEARAAAGYTQRQFAEALNGGQRAVVYWESGRHSPTPDTLDRIAELTGRPVHWFFTAPEDEAVA